MTPRVVVAGAGGGVGASLVFNLLLSALACEVVMVDARENMLHSHLWDLEQVLEQVSLLDRVAGGWPGTLILVTNPVDPLCTWALRRTGLSRERLLGYTLNDSLRLRTGIGRVLGVAPGRVEAWMVGEHGALAVPLWDRVTVDGERVALSDTQRGAVMEFVSGWYVRHVALDSGRSSTWTSGLGLSRMVGACIDPDGAALWPASVMLRGEYGVDGVSLSVPVRLGAGGAQRIEEWELSAPQLAAVDRAARFVREAADGL